MSGSDTPVLTSTQGGIAEIRFNRPRHLNAIDLTTAQALLAAVTQVTADASVRVIVLSAEGRAFIAGGDLGYFQSAGAEAPEAARALITPIHEAMERLAAAAQPVIASVQGPVAGAGMSIAMLADLTVAADDAVFNMAYVKVGNNPDCSGTWSLPRLVGLKKAMELALLADNIPAPQALALGLVNRVVPRHELETHTQALATRLADAAPLALAATKRLLRQSLGRTLPEQLADEAASFAANAGSQDFREALAAFFDKRPGRFTGS